MSKRKQLERLVGELERGGISRRDFVWRALALGISVSSAGAVLSACGGGDKGGQAGAGAQGETELGPIEKELHIYNWSDYIADDTVPNFEKEFGVKVTYDTYESNEEMVAKLQAGATGYDIIVPSGYIIPVLVATDLITTLNKKNLTNWGNVAPIFQNLPSDPGSTHTVPWQWGTSGIAYRTDKMKSPVDSWAVFHDREFRGKMTMMDDGREVIGAFLRYRGHSLNSTDPQQLAKAKADSDPGQEAAQGVPLGAGEGAAHLGRRVDLAALERRYHPGEGGAAKPRLRDPQGGMHHLGRLDVHSQERAQQARGARVDELHPPPGGGRRPVRRDRLRHAERGRAEADGDTHPVSDRG